MHKLSIGLVIAACVAGMAPAMAADGVPADALVVPEAKNKTVWQFPKPNSAVVELKDHRRDLSKWPTVSYDDKRPTPKPETKQLVEPLNGDAERGKKLAMNTQGANCWACHALPGDAQPGTVGPTLIGYGKLGHSNQEIFQHIWDQRVINPQTVMPPFGTFGNLSEQDIRDIVAFVQSN
ncbi:MAG: sulfur oxidation c-type cytochrome SoxX [Hyphomicrobiaceae bacterium]